MYEIDASSIVHAWENYPITQFPKLWDWFADEFESNKLSISKVAFDEVAHKFPELSTWLNNLSIEPVKTNVEIIKIALTISQQLGIDDDYSKKGVDENDLFIIANAKRSNRALISNEAVQSKPPENLKNCKIPAVCALPFVSIECLNILEYIKKSGKTFS
ncbi:MAG: DUF4411 family protein [Leptospiraceae bacterium]|nr:DUF4411 family protein [Leptospiraceae bacterium]